MLLTLMSHHPLTLTLPEVLKLTPEPAEETLELGTLIGEFGALWFRFLALKDVGNVGASFRAASWSCSKELLMRDQFSQNLHVWSASVGWDKFLKGLPQSAPQLQHWRALPRMSEARTDFLCCLMGRCIYICGGTRKGVATNSAERFNIDSGKWEFLPPVLGRRRVDSEATVAALDGHLYICGGLDMDKSSASNCVDRYSPEWHHWETLPSMPMRRCRAAAAVVQDQLYLCGGSEDGRTPIKSVVCLDAKTGHWEVVPPMIEKYMGALAIVDRSNIYIGYRGEDFSLVSAERFNAQTRTWSRCPAAILSTPGSSVAAVVSRHLWIFGGAHCLRTRQQQAVLVVGSDLRDESLARQSTRVLRQHYTL